MNVNSKNANVSLPNEFCSVVFIPRDGTKARAAKHNKLGQPIPTVIHKNKTDMNTPRTFIPSALRPDGGVAIKKTIRRIKAGTLWKNSLIRKVLKWIGKCSGKLVDFARAFSRNTAEKIKVLLVGGAFLFLQFLIIGCGFTGAGVFLIILLIVDAAAVIFIIRKADGLDLIMDGLKKISDGELQYKIKTDTLTGKQKVMAEYINNIVSFLNKREVDERGIDSGIIIFSTSYICAHTLCFLSFIFWLIYKITRVNVIQMAFNNMLVLSIFFVIICAVIYITNYLFLFKKNKYEFFFVKFNTDKKYTLYYGIFLFSLTMQCILVWIMISC